MSYRTPWHWLPMEGRALTEYALVPWQQRSLQLERGDGHTVLVFPGFGADDGATKPLRRALKLANYDAQGWGLGRNLGMNRGLGQRMQKLLLDAHERSGATVSLIGWSLGGVFARELARRHPDKVRQVITLGSPIQDGDHTTVGVLFSLKNPKQSRRTPPEEQAKRSEPPPVPCSAIYTQSDGIVPWRASLEQERPHTRNVRVRGSHMGLPANPQVWRHCARMLAHPKG